MKPHLLVVAGPNGSGKTTLTNRLRHDKWSDSVEYLNPDEVARDRFGDWNSPEAVLAAARWTSARRDELLAAVYVYDNSPEGEEATLGVRVEDGQLRKIYGSLPAWVESAVVNLPRHPAFVDLRQA